MSPTQKVWRNATFDGYISITKLRAKLAKLELPPRFSVDAVDRGYVAALHDVVVWLDEHEKGAEA